MPSGGIRRPASRTATSMSLRVTLGSLQPDSMTDVSGAATASSALVQHPGPGSAPDSVAGPAGPGGPSGPTPFPLRLCFHRVYIPMGSTAVHLPLLCAAAIRKNLDHLDHLDRRGPEALSQPTLGAAGLHPLAVVSGRSGGSPTVGGPRTTPLSPPGAPSPHTNSATPSRGPPWAPRIGD